MNHMQSLRFEHKLYAAVKEKMEEMQQHNMSWIEVRPFVFQYRFLFYFSILFDFSSVRTGPIFEKGSWYPMSVPENLDVHICLRLLFEEE